MLRSPVPAHDGQLEQAVAEEAEEAEEEAEAGELPLRVQALELRQEPGRGDWN